jgi:DNA-binding transcriptional ArsR family regulator
VRAAHSADVDAVFSALADPTRRAVLQALADSGGGTATQLAGRFPVTRQAVSKHLATLSAAGLVEARRNGRETQYVVTPDAMTDALAWMATVGARWDRRLAALKRQAEAG